jgi:uncharacterized membrane protein YdfJ with MMPL/SSD domain
MSWVHYFMLMVCPNLALGSALVTYKFASHKFTTPETYVFIVVVLVAIAAGTYLY